jgi:hypothetical protein
MLSTSHASSSSSINEVSILYWRCKIKQFRCEAKDIIDEGFNSLLEMLLLRLSTTRRIVQFQFSIGDAGTPAVSSRAATSGCFNSLLEMLQLLPTPYWQEWILFQFSIGDAHEVENKLYEDVVNGVSILYWRCWVSWGFGCVGF